MEYAILFAALLAGAAVMFLKGLWDQHRAQKWNREQLRKSFGKAGRTEYADGELNGIVRYFEKHPKDFQIDDITWNDLNLDEIFLRMNSTCSSAGRCRSPTSPGSRSWTTDALRPARKYATMDTRNATQEDKR